nr:MAG: ribosomal protein L11 [Candidatus Nanosalinarum sp. J07AB56]
MTETVDLLVEGGQASAGPPLGPSLAPIEGVDVGQIVADINEETGGFEGMEVPVTVEVDEDTGSHTVEVGTPPAAQLVMEELGIDPVVENPMRTRWRTWSSSSSAASPERSPPTSWETTCADA